MHSNLIAEENAIRLLVALDEVVKNINNASDILNLVDIKTAVKREKEIPDSSTSELQGKLKLVAHALLTLECELSVIQHGTSTTR